MTKINNILNNKTSILLGKNIVYLRQLHQWSQDDLSQKMNSDKGYLSQIERLCEVFNVEPEELFKNRDFNFKNRVDSREQL